MATRSSLFVSSRRSINFMDSTSYYALKHNAGAHNCQVPVKNNSMMTTSLVYGKTADYVEVPEAASPCYRKRL